MSDFCANTLDGKDGQMILKDAFGHDHQCAVTTWKGRSFIHPSVYKHIRQLLDNLELYEPRRDDVWVLTYPKNGANVLYEIISMLTSGSVSPAPNFVMDNLIEFYRSIDYIDPTKPYRQFHTHIDPDILPAALYEGPCKVVSILRNPLSMALEWYCFHITSINHPDLIAYGGTAREFMLAVIYGSNPTCSKNSLWNTWFEYAKAIWRKYNNHPHTMHVMFYEELEMDPVANIQALAQFLGKEYSQETYQQIAELTKFDNIAEGGKNKTEKVLPSGITLTPFINVQLSDWKKHLSDDDFKEFHHYFQDQLKDYPDLMDRVIFE